MRSVIVNWFREKKVSIVKFFILILGVVSTDCIMASVRYGSDMSLIEKFLSKDTMQTFTSNVDVKGIVVDAQKEPLVGVAVTIKGTTIGCVTDSKGEFSISTSDKKITLVFSMIGMETQELIIYPFQSKKSITIVMKNKDFELGDVVVTGIFKKSKGGFTGSATTVTEKELQSFKGKNLVSTIKNIDPTFNILESNAWGSDPNNLPNVQIRGTSSLPTVDELKNETRVNVNTPLIVLDGFEIPLSKMYDLNDDDISSVTILKDGSATAIYGSRGSNGVIVIETKKPQEGKLRLSYRGELNIETPDLSDYNLLNSHEKLQLEWNAGLYDSKFSNSKMSLMERYAYIKGEIASGVETYWLSKPLRIGIGQRHNLRIEGGGAGGFRYAASLQYNDVKGVMKESSHSNFNGGIDLMYEKNKLSFRNNLSVGYTEAIKSPYGSFSQYTLLNPYWRISDKNGKVKKILEKSNDNFFNPAPENPIYNAQLDLLNKNTLTNIINNFSMEWKPFDDFIVRSRLGVMKGFSYSDNFKPASHTDFKDYSEEKIFRKGKYIYSTGNNLNYDLDFTISYSHIFKEKHNLYLGVNYNIAQRQSEMYTFTMEGFPQDKIKMLSMALQYEEKGKPMGFESKDRRIGITGNINYIYDNKYFTDFAYRVDGSSQFGHNKRFAPFYSIGLGWNLNEETFLKNVKWLDRLKLRGSYAVTGAINFNPYQALASYEYYMNDRYRYWFGSHLMGIANEDLEWQKTKKWDLGVEISILGSRIRFIADYYNNNTDNLLSEMYLPLANGFPSYTDNIGKVRNSGVELSLSTFIIKTNKWNWNITASLINEKNKIVKISDALKIANENMNKSKQSNPNFLYREGGSLRTIYVVPSLGIDPSTGRELYRNRFGEITYEWDARDRVDCGNYDPKVRGLINAMVSYKKFSLNMSLSYRLGGDIYNSTLVDRVENADPKYNVDKRVFDKRWKQPGDRTFFKNIKDHRPTYMSSRFVQRENVLECQNLQLKYDLSNAWIKKHLGMSYLSLIFSTDNLFRLSTVKQERGLNYPFSRRYTFSLSTTF